MTAPQPSTQPANSSAPTVSGFVSPPRANGANPAQQAPHLAPGSFPNVRSSAASAAVHAQQQRSDFMDELYRLSGRTNGLMTGLWQQFRLDTYNQFMNEMADDLAHRARSNWVRPLPLQQS